MIAQLAAEVAREGENHPVCEDHDGLDSPEYVDIFHDDTSGRASDPAGVTAGRQRNWLQFATACSWPYFRKPCCRPTLKHDMGELLNFKWVRSTMKDDLALAVNTVKTDWGITYHILFVFYK